MERENEGDEAILRAAALGQLDRDAPEVAERLRADPELRRAVDELERTHRTTARVLKEGAEMAAGARAGATPADRALVEGTIRELARGGAQERAGRRRGWTFLVAGLAAAGLLVFFLVRGSGPTSDVWLGADIGLEYVESGAGPGELRWEIELGSLERLELSFYAFRDGARRERLLGPLSVAHDGWRPTTPEDARALGSDWLAELTLTDASGDTRLVGQLRHSSSH